MAKSFLHINKIKSYGTLKARWNHDIDTGFRVEHVSNANPDMVSRNDILLACIDDSGIEISYDKAVKNRIKDKKQPNGKSIRKDAVLAYDIVLEFGDSDDIEAEGIDVEEWERRTVEWLKDTFNIAGDGKDNVLSVVCHKDEASPHIHAIVTPVNESGCLCAKTFTDGSAALSRLQDSYAQRLSDLGIERGIKGSSAHQKSNRTYNSEKNKAKRIPEPLPGQNAAEYIQMYSSYLEETALALKLKYDKTERELRAKNDSERILQKKMIKEEIESLTVYFEEEKEIYEEQVKTAYGEIAKIKQEVDTLSYQKEELEARLNQMRKAESKASLFEYYQKIYEYAKIASPELAEELTAVYKEAEQQYLDAKLISQEL